MQEELKDLSSFLTSQNVDSPDQQKPTNNNNNNIEEYDEDDTVSEVIGYEKKLTRRLISLAVIFLGSLYLSLTNITGVLNIPSIIDPWTNTTYYLFALLALLVATMAVDFNVVANGIKGFFTGKVSYDVPAAICSVVTFAHVIYDIVIGGIKEYDGTIYVSVAILVFLANCGGKLLVYKRSQSNLEIAAQGTCKTEVIISEDRLIDNIMEDQGFDFPTASINQEVGTLKHISDITYSPDFSEDITKYSFPIMVVLGALISAGLCLLTNNSLDFGIDYFVAMVCVSSALTEAFVSNIPFWKVDKKLHKEGSFIAGYETLEAFEDVNAIIVEDRELYPNGSLKLHGMKTFNEKQANEIIVDAASLMSESDGIMKDVLISTINGDVSQLHDVSSIKVTSAGTSGKIGGTSILMGSCDYMIENGVALSQEAMDFEGGYLHSGKSIMYQAENNELVAIFVVSYRPSRKMAKELQTLSKFDYTIILYSSDPNINASKVSADYGFEERFIKQVTDEQRTEMLSKLAPSDAAVGYLAIGEDSKNRIKIFNTINLLRKNIKLGVILQTVFMAIEYLIYIAMMIFTPNESISFVHILAFKAVFSMFALLPGMFFKF